MNKGPGVGKAWEGFRNRRKATAEGDRAVMDGTGERLQEPERRPATLKVEGRTSLAQAFGRRPPRRSLPPTGSERYCRIPAVQSNSKHHTGISSSAGSSRNVRFCGIGKNQKRQDSARILQEVLWCISL
eukprot:XP_011246552.1 PREDICTED: uncharacterized protein 4930401G09Rik [Mus musculus]